MRALLTTMLMAVLIPAAAALADRDFGRHRDTLVVVERERLLRELDLTADMLSSVLSRKHDQRLQGQLGEIRARIADLKRDIARAPTLESMQKPVVVRPPPPPPAPVVVRPPPPVRRAPMDQDKFSALISAIRAQSFSDNKLSVIRSAAAEHHFVVGQVVKVLEQLSFSGEKLEVVRTLKSRILDRENHFKLYEAFTFSSDKKALERILSD